MRRCTILGLWILAVATAASASAANEPYLLAYAEYRDALAASKYDLAREHAHSAWLKAKEGSAPPGTRALLAHNFIELTVTVDAPRALAALDDAVALAADGIGTDNYPLRELQVYQAFAEAEDKDWRRRESRRFADAVADYGDQGGTLNSVMSKVLFLAIPALNGAQRSADAVVVSRYLATSLAATEDADPRLQAAANIARVSATILDADLTLSNVDRNSTRNMLQDMRILVNQTIALLPMQTSIDDYDPLYATAVGWRGALQSLLHTAELEPDPDHTFEGMRFDDDVDWRAFLLAPEGTPLSCNIEWTERDIEYPQSLLARSTIGTTLLGLRLTPEGRVIEPKLLAEIPQQNFGRAVLKQVQEWRADVSDVEDPACLDNQLAMIVFAINR